jgi:hypothetical protein
MVGLGGSEAVDTSTSMDLTSILGSLVGGGVMAIVGMIKSAMSK